LEVEYKQFTIKAVELTQGKWRAQMWHTSVKRFSARRRLQPLVTAEDRASAADALRAAIDAIDAGVFSHRPKPERYWRRKRGDAPAPA
jgi:hypothetical protein